MASSGFGQMLNTEFISSSSSLGAAVDRSNGGYEYTAGFAGKSATSSSLAVGVSPTDSTLTLASAAGFSVAGGRAILGGSEIISYTGVSGNNLTGVSRGLFGSSSGSHGISSTIHNSNFAWDSNGGYSYTEADVSGGVWKKFELSRLVHLSSDIPYWSSPTPSNHIDKGIFGGLHLPRGTTKLIDYTSSDWADGSTGSLFFEQCKVGDFLNCRFDFEVIPQVANTNLQIGLTFATRNPETKEVTFEFPLTTSPVFFGVGSVGQTFLLRPIITAYFASNEDLYALALPAVKSDNPIIIRPNAMLVNVVR